MAPTPVPTYKYASTIGDGTNLQFTIHHDLDTSDVVVAVYEAVSMEMVIADIKVVDQNKINISLGEPPSKDSLRVVVIG